MSALGSILGTLTGLAIGAVLVLGYNWLEDRPQRLRYRAYWDAELARSRSLAEREAWIRDPRNPISAEHRAALLLELHRGA